MTLGVTTADYAIRVRDGNRNLLGEVDAYDQFQAVLRFNAVSDWQMQLSASHPLAGALATKGNGIIVTRIIRDAFTRKVLQSSVLLSGPVRRIQRKKQGNALIVAGKDDTMVLAAHDAWPAGGLPFMAQALLLNPIRYYKLAESAGTTATDSSLTPQAGTYAATGVTYGVTGPVAGDPTTAVTFASASSGKMTGSGSGLPSGNAPFWMACAFKFSANPAAAQKPGGFGNLAFVNNQFVEFQLQTTGAIIVNVGGGNVSSAINIATNVWHLIVATWDGTTLRFYLDGVAVGTPATPGAMNLPASPTQTVGCGLSSANFFNGQMADFLIGAGTPTAADVSALWAAFSATHAASDTRSGQASTILQQYVSANAISATNTDRNIAGLTLGTDPLAGSTVPGNERFTSLVSKDGSGALQRLALASTPALGFRVVQVGANLQFQVYVPSDKTAVAKFSDDLGNLADFDYVVEAPDLDSGGNYAVVLGGGVGAGRAAYAAQDATSVSSWGRAEMVVDARDTTDTATLATRASDAIAQAKEKTSFSAVLAPVQSQVYGIDFNLGDKVSVVVDATTFTDIIREVKVTLDAAGGETIEPAVGSPNAATVQNALATFAQSIQRMQSRVSYLERVQ